MDLLKFQKNEAITRLRSNTLGLVTTLFVTTVLPVPSPLYAFLTIFRIWPSRMRTITMDGEFEDEIGMVEWSICLIEVLVAALFASNVLQASYALKYPPKPRPPRPTPKRSIFGSPEVASSSPRSIIGITPSSTPQQQRPFSVPFSTISTPGSTPSRMLDYTMPTSGSGPRYSGASASLSGSLFNTSLNSSTSSFVSTPSPLAAFNGRRSMGAGRAVDSPLFERMAAAAHEEGDD